MIKIGKKSSYVSCELMLILEKKIYSKFCEEVIALINLKYYYQRSISVLEIRKKGGKKYFNGYDLQFE